MKRRKTVRKAGFLMPVASLPSSYGVGDFGPTSYHFIDLIKKCGFKIWQILPLNPLGFGNSPYQPYSSKAMDELYVSLELLVEEGLLLEVKPYRSKSRKIDYERVRKYKERHLHRAFDKFKPDQGFKHFVEQKWVQNYAIFLTLKKKNNLQCWTEWPAEEKEWIKDKKMDLSSYSEAIQYELFIQYVLFKQWNHLRKYANNQGVCIMGDIPIYVGIDSEDVWANQKNFLLDKEGRPTFIAGVPPDFFSEEGQRWGNPLYNWKQIEKEGFEFWLDRLEYNQKLFDIIRIDHFRAFDTYWKIPAACPTAIEGEWVEAPGYALFETIYDKYPKMKIVAEDLGDLRQEVLELRDHFNIMGMRIVQYSFTEEGMKQDRPNLIAYTGTHDNEPLQVWYKKLSALDKKWVTNYLKNHRYQDKDMIDNLLQYTLDSQAEIVILPITDILKKRESGRLNSPGTVGSPNWEWRLPTYEELNARLPIIKKMIEKSGR